MAVYTIAYKFTYVYETVRSLHIREREKIWLTNFDFLYKTVIWNYLLMKK